MSSPVLKSIKAVQARADDFRTLLDADAGDAIRQARAMKTIPTLEQSVRLLKAGVLIDAGGITGQVDVVQEGVDILRQLFAADPNQASYKYNLANGLITLANLDSTPFPAWYLVTRSLRQQARELWDAVPARAQDDLKTQALTNLGNALAKSHRWSEAHDAYVAALRVDPSNGVAAGQAARMLLSGVCAGMGNPQRMRQVAQRYAAIAKAHHERVTHLAGSAVSDVFGRLPSHEENPQQASRSIKNAYLRFVAQHHLALVPTIEGLDASLRRWDSLRICCFSEAVSAGPEPPPLYAMLNSIKAGYLAARKLAFQPERPSGDTSLYVDTLDYARYGTSTAMLLLSQRAALDVLDQIAVALNDYLKVGLDPKDVYFAGFWMTGKKQPQWRPVLEREIADGNKAVIALGELAEDLKDGGYLYRKRLTRNASTHRFTVLHDMKGSFRANSAVEHRDLEDFRNETIETLQTVRAAILYFVEAIAIREHRTRPTGKVGKLFLVAHHRVRGYR